MTFGFHPDALQEYQEAGAWYEEQRYLLGVEFSSAVESAIAQILNDPGRQQPAGERIRVFRLKRFPYYIFYRFNETARHVRIVAIVHRKRRPDYWRQRI